VNTRFPNYEEHPYKGLVADGLFNGGWLEKGRHLGQLQMKKELILDKEASVALTQLREICLGLPNVTESLTFGNPTFKVGRKVFAVLDRYKGEYCVWVLCDSALRKRLLLKDDAFFPAPYDKKQVAICRKLNGLNWSKFKPMILTSYELAIG